MEHVERFLKAMVLKEPDRIPIDLGGPVSGITKVAYDGLKTRLGMETLSTTVWDRMQQLAEIDERILKRFDTDFRHIGLNPPRKDEMKEISDECFINEWSITLKKCGYYFEIVEELAPLCYVSSISDIEKYREPEPHEGRLQGLKEIAKGLCDQNFAVTFDAFTGGVLELAVWLRGFKKFYYDLVANPELANALLDKTLELHKKFWKAILNEVGDHVHIVLYGDDYGMQHGMLISPKMWRERIKPRVKELFSFIKREAKVKIQLHSCGSIRPIIGDLIEIGLDILNPVQPLAKDMDSYELKNEFGSKLCFHGGIDVQWVLPKGSPRDVEEEVKRRINAFAPRGGYILATAHNIQPDVPPENIVTLFDAAHEYGKYPIK